VVAWRGGVLTAVEPTGRVHWALSRPTPITTARWSPVDGYRIAYTTGGTLRVVNGDGSGDHAYGRARAVAPAWRPDAEHVLAYVDTRGHVVVVAVDTRHRLWRSAPTPEPPVALAWSASGARLLVLTRRRVVVYDRSGRLLAAHGFPGAQAVAWSTRAPVVALVRSGAATGTSELVLLDAAHGLRARRVFSGPGRFGAPAWSPDGGTVLLPWQDAGQWLFLRPAGSGRPIAIANVAREFAPGAARPHFPAQVDWCCG
jgi:hypothetical protein